MEIVPKCLKIYNANKMVENIPNNLKTYNNRMCKNDDKVNKDFNLVYDNMSGSVKYNLEYLNRLAKNVKANNKSKAESLIKLYADRQIPNITTVEKTNQRCHWIWQCEG